MCISPNSQGGLYFCAYIAYCYVLKNHKPATLNSGESLLRILSNNFLPIMHSGNHDAMLTSVICPN